MNNYIEKIMKSKYFSFVFIGLAIIAVLVISFSGKNSTKKDKKTGDIFNEFEYTSELENKIVNIVKKIDGAGKTSVMVSVDNSYETFYAVQGTTNQKNNEKSNDVNEKSIENNITENFVIVKNDNEENGLEITKFTPTVKGVLVICEGGKDENLSKKITSAISTVLGISEQKVCVIQNKS